MNFFLKKSKILKYLLIVSIAFSSLSANNYRFVPKKLIDVDNKSYSSVNVNLADQQKQLINNLILLIQAQNKLLNNSFNLKGIGLNGIQNVDIKAKDEKEKNSKFKKSLSFVGRNALSLSKFAGKSFFSYFKDMTAKMFRRTAALSTYLSLASFAYWRITGRNPLIPAKESYRFSKFLLKKLLSRKVTLPKEKLKNHWVYKFNKIWDAPGNLLFGKAKKSSEYGDRFSPDEIMWGGGVLLVYLLLLK
ncbi:hypothetical protein GF385_01455 [Candidatus Dependentiae bacterium]|nr:hypothetical protein [Candidatus Dependentiae bacterium]